MTPLTDIAQLDTLYRSPVPTSLTKVTPRLTPHYRAWIQAARFAILSTVGPEGCDASPRGDTGPVLRIADDTTLHLPDWRGNNRLDSLRNLIRDPRASLMLLVPGSNNVVRLNGTAIVTDDAALRHSFERKGIIPATVIVFSLSEAYFQCAKALMRSDLWNAQIPHPPVPTAGDFLTEAQQGFDGARYDADYPDRAKGQLW